MEPAKAHSPDKGLETVQKSDGNGGAGHEEQRHEVDPAVIRMAEQSIESQADEVKAKDVDQHGDSAKRQAP